MTERNAVPVLTIWQPWATAAVVDHPRRKTPENRTWPVPSTLPNAQRCERCGQSTADADAEGLFDWCSGGTRCEWIEQEGPFPFRLAVHAGQKVDRDAMRDRHVLEVVGEDAALPRGAIVGFVTVTGCHHADECVQRRYPCPMCMDLPGPRCGLCNGSGYAVSYCSRWALPDQYHWTSDDPLELDRPWQCRGRQGIWYLRADAAREMEQDALTAVTVEPSDDLQRVTVPSNSGDDR